MKQHPMADTLVGDADGIHRAGSLNDRLELGLKKTKNEAELNILLVRPDGGIRTKAAPGELCSKLSIGFLGVDEEAEVLFNHHAAVTPIKTVFERFAKLGYACRVWLWFHTKGLNFPKKPAERSALLALGRDFRRVWFSATTTVRDQKELPRTMLEEVRIAVFRDEWQASLFLCLRGGHPKEIDGKLPRPASDPTNWNTLSLLRQLPALHPDAVIAGNLNWQGRTTACGLSFIDNSVGNLRRQWKITRFETHTKLPAGKLLSLKHAVKNCRKVTSTLNRWKNFCSSPIFAHA